MGETPGGRCSGSSTTHNTTCSRWKTGLATHGIENPGQARARDAFQRHRPNVSSAAAVIGWRCSELHTHGPPKPDAEYRVMLLRRLRLPLPFAPKRCPCGGDLDVYGDYRSACAQVGVLARRACPLERAAARRCYSCDFLGCEPRVTHLGQLPCFFCGSSEELWRQVPGWRTLTVNPEAQTSQQTKFGLHRNLKPQPGTVST